jgi:hypothetical protein
MNPEEHFGKDWRPEIVREETIAEGTWWYDGKVPYSIKLKHLHLNYTCLDITNFQMFIHELDWEHPVGDVSVDGNTYQWIFDGPTGQSSSPCFVSIKRAKDHLKTYGKSDIKWNT